MVTKDDYCNDECRTGQWFVVVLGWLWMVNSCLIVNYGLMMLNTAAVVIIMMKVIVLLTVTNHHAWWLPMVGTDGVICKIGVLNWRSWLWWFIMMIIIMIVKPYYH